MRTKHMIYASVLVAALGIASPSLAQDGRGGSSSSPSPSLDATLTAVKTQANGNGNAQFDHSSYTSDPLSLNNMLNGSFDGTTNDNRTKIEANQTVTASIGGDALTDASELAKTSGDSGRGPSGSNSSVGYQSGSNSINGNAFAAYAGIMNVAWNTGVDTNAQTATNIAAQGNVNFTTTH